MKKMLLIAIGLMFSCLSASTLPDHVSVVNYEKITTQTPPSILDAQSLYVENVVVSSFVLQANEPVRQLNFNYVPDIDVVNIKGFYRPILYECSDKINPLANYDIYKAKDKFKNEIVVDNEFRIQNVPKDFELV